jgi:hypothetical protein
VGEQVEGAGVVRCNRRQYVEFCLITREFAFRPTFKLFKSDPYASRVGLGWPKPRRAEPSSFT